MENNDEYDDDEITVYAACQGCAHDVNDGICNVPGPCQAYPNAEAIEPPEMLMLPAVTLTTPEVAAPVEEPIFPAAGIDDGRLFA